jgi:uncharacterized membrane protein YbhN (UPF0104 family)
MTITRTASAGAGRRRTVRAASAAFAVAALTAAGVGERASVTASFGVIGRLHWLWILAAIAVESASMAAFAMMLRRLLASGGTSVGVRPMLATSLAANALSVSIPLAGPEVATVFTFRRFARHGADAPLAGWSLLCGGVVSSAAAALVLAGGALASGNVLVAGIAVPDGVLAVAVLLVVGAAARRPRLRDTLERPATWALRRTACLLRGVKRAVLGRAFVWRRGRTVGGEPGTGPRGGGGPARERRARMREYVGQGVSRARHRTAVGRGGVETDAMDRSCPPRFGRHKARPPATAGRTR